MSSRILVPLDAHRASEAALPAAVERARLSDASLYLLYVVATPVPGAADSLRHRAALRRAERRLAAVRRRITADVELGVSAAVWSGSPAAAIVKAADLIDADLIVIARSGRTGPPRALVGSVVDRVLRGTRRPVLVVTPPDATVNPLLGDAAPLPDAAAPTRGNTAAAAPVGHAIRDAQPREAYLTASRTVEERERQVLDLVTTIQRAAKSLERWPAVHVTRAGAGFPKDVTMLGRAIDASTWPTGQQLGDTLAAWHAAVEAARLAWARVPRAERSTLSSPP